MINFFVTRLCLASFALTSLSAATPASHDHQIPTFSHIALEQGGSSVGKPASCLLLKRPLNPSRQAPQNETMPSRYFRLAYNYAIEADFNNAIWSYRQASKYSICKCDNLHAQAGERAAHEARLAHRIYINSRATQLFWNKLQDLTKDLECLNIR
jgi:hypothetical protein